jgi:hypothetical protein
VGVEISGAAQGGAPASFGDGGAVSFGLIMVVVSIEEKRERSLRASEQVG